LPTAASGSTRARSASGGRRYSNWRRFGEDDELGTLNFITRDRVLAAASTVRSGLVVSCALPFGAGDGDTDTPRGACWESLARVARDGRVYNDRDPAELPAAGARTAAIDRFADGVVGRGVLLDLTRFVGRSWLDDDTRILPADLDACAEAFGVTIDTGDILLVRTGRLSRCFAQGSWQGYADGTAPGLSLRCARWLFERQVAAVATDTARVEVQPAETHDSRCRCTRSRCATWACASATPSTSTGSPRPARTTGVTRSCSPPRRSPARARSTRRSTRSR
jgi:hypothetical protein